VIALAACSSSSGKPAAVHAAGTDAATTTTQPRAIGLRTNADEQAENIPDVPLDAATQARQTAQLAAARATALKYPTVADALKAGYILAGKFTPGAGAHYISFSAGKDAYAGSTDFDAANPLALIYDGTFPTSRVVGVMFGSYTLNPPQGFAGPNDHWHRHSNLCITFSKGQIGIPYPPDSNVTKAECDTAHGQFMRKTLWMVHAWVVPSYPSPQGVFSHANINLKCGDGTDNVDAVGFCVGSRT
jgi:hypothetical protein